MRGWWYYRDMQEKQIIVCTDKNESLLTVLSWPKNQSPEKYVASLASQLNIKILHWFFK